MSSDINDQAKRKPCSCCSGGSKEKIVLCDLCVHPERFRVYCMNCNLRMDMSLNEAQRLFEKTEAIPTPKRVGTVYCYVFGCHTCKPDMRSYRIREFTIFASYLQESVGSAGSVY